MEWVLYVMLLSKIANLARVSETDGWVVHRLNENSNYGSPIMPCQITVDILSISNYQDISQMKLLSALWTQLSGEHVRALDWYDTNEVICKLSVDIKNANTEITKDFETAQLWVVH